MNNQIFHVNDKVVIGREMPIRLSGNKIQHIKNQGTNLYSQNSSQNPKIKQKKLQQESLFKLNNSMDNSQMPTDIYINIKNSKNKVIDSFQQDQEFTQFTPTADEKNSSFLPKLDINHRFSNSQVQYRDPNEFQRSEQKEKNDTRSPQQNWNHSLEKQTFSSKKSSFSQDKKIQNIQVNFNAQQFQQKNTYLFNNGNVSYTNSLHFKELSPSNNSSNIKDYSELYSLKNGIGKIQPVPEIKAQFNEQVIRGKIYKDKNIFNSETPSKIDSKHLSLTKSSNYNAALSEVVSPKSLGESLMLNFQFDPTKPVKADTSKQPSKQSNSKASELSEDLITDKVQTNQFHHRNSSLSQVSHQNNTNEKISTSIIQQYSTIEEVIRTSRDNDSFIHPSLQTKVIPQNLTSTSNIISNSNIQIEDEDNVQSFLSDRKFLSSNKQTSNYSQNEEINKSSISNSTNVVQIQLQKQFHHTIKTVASKQMPKCFRMSKHQLQIINRQQIRGGGNTTNASNTNKMLDDIPRSFEQTFVVQKQGSSQQRSISNDARVSFNPETHNNQYQAISKARADFQYQSRPSQNKISSNLFSEGQNSISARSSINNDNLEVDRERMTPAFNARQSYKE